MRGRGKKIKSPKQFPNPRRGEEGGRRKKKYQEGGDGRGGKKNSEHTGSVDAKINTLKSEGKCSPSSGKSTKRASQFDLKLTREKTKSNSRAYHWDSEYLSHRYIGKLCRYNRRQKGIKCKCITNECVGGISRCTKRQNWLEVADYAYITKSKVRMCNLDNVN